MYPLNMQTADAQGFAVANTEAEHVALSDLGYLPAHAGEAAPVAPAAEEPAKRKPGRPRKDAQ